MVIKKIDPNGRGKWTTNNSGQRVYYVPDRRYNYLRGRMYREDGSSHSSYWDPAGNCFVATAVYGDRNAPQVELLRGFRDNVLIRSSLGRSLVDFYYSGSGEKTANFIKEHLPSAIPVIRRGLDTLVKRYSAQGIKKPTPTN